MVILNNKLQIESILKEKGMTLLYFSSNTCSACTAIKSKLEIALKKFPNLKVYEIPPFNTEEILANFSIFTFPAVLLYIDEKEYIREAKYFSVEKLLKDIDRYYTLSSQ